MRFVNAGTAFELEQFSAYYASYSNLSGSILYRTA